MEIVRWSATPLERRNHLGGGDGNRTRHGEDIESGERSIERLRRAAAIVFGLASFVDAAAYLGDRNHTDRVPSLVIEFYGAPRHLPRAPIDVDEN